MEFITIRRAARGEADRVADFLDEHLAKIGIGFVTKAQVKTETMGGRIWIALKSSEIVGVRIGIEKVYNMVVHPDYRGLGIGRELILVHPPKTIRVKSEPVGNWSKKQKESFVSPEGFYRALGYELSHIDHAKNFWQRGSDKAHFHKKGKKHIRVYVRPDRLINGLK